MEGYRMKVASMYLAIELASYLHNEKYHRLFVSDEIIVIKEVIKNIRCIAR